jgi:hypothetical protein
MVSGAASPTSTWQTCRRSASGCFRGAQNPRHDHLGETARPPVRNGFDFEARHGQQVAELLRIQFGIDEAA